MPSFIVKNGPEKPPQKRGCFCCIFGLFFLNFFVFFPLFLLISCCFMLSWNPKTAHQVRLQAYIYIKWLKPLLVGKFASKISKLLEGREVQNCELKKFSVFRDNYCISKGHVERLPPLPHRQSGFLLGAAMDFLAEYFGGRLSVACTALTAEKYTPKIRAKIRWKNSVKTFRFSVRFSVHFSVCFR